MGLLQEYLRRLRDRKDSKKDFAWERHVEEDFAERKKNSDERELERFHEEDRKELIKKALKIRRKDMNDEIWSGRKGNPAFAPNIIKEEVHLFSGRNDFAEVPNIMHTQNITKVRNIFKSQ